MIRALRIPLPLCGPPQLLSRLFRVYKPEAQAKPIVPPSAAPSRPVNFGSGDLALIAVCLHYGVW